MNWPTSSRLLLFTARASAATAITLLTACVSVQVHPLTQQSYPPRTGGDPMSFMQKEPSRPYIKLAKIVATSRYASENTLQNRIMDRARGLGADAVILSKVTRLNRWDQVRSMNRHWVRPAPITVRSGEACGLPFIWIHGVSSKVRPTNGN